MREEPDPCLVARALYRRSGAVVASNRGWLVLSPCARCVIWIGGLGFVLLNQLFEQGQILRFCSFLSRMSLLEQYFVGLPIARPLRKLKMRTRVE